MLLMQEYNSVSDELRADCEVRADLHQRVDDVRDRLWSISDERKEQAEAERAAVMGDSWLDDHLGLLDNHFITLMQAELDRYHDTVVLLRDYYRAMEGHVPDELATDYARLPLLEVSPPYLLTERSTTERASTRSECCANNRLID